MSPQAEHRDFGKLYTKRLQSIPAPGGGGCHTAILGVANLGILSGLNAETIFQDIRCSIPSGSRKVTDKEITDAINKALADHHGGSYTPRPRPTPVIKDGAAAFQQIINSAKIHDESDVWELSPIRIDWPPEEDVRHAL